MTVQRLAEAPGEPLVVFLRQLLVAEDDGKFLVDCRSVFHRSIATLSLKSL
ncbi:hypothetical protein [Bradyrhizobium sp. CIR3A]|uniref:hypothetical protein n=1 Tax=Bradyrhizobium sp. CIR3A TaxID=2663838 RepID=UPI0016067CF3|nr:hypothetical protein [Bradyrhizobium sp. CIR3A]MBB4259932.1 hypothetical protein [Bradyrhizobium sp. CIR3A]